MRFYLTYKDHGFYDPVVDDTEVIYIPVDPEELEILNIQTNTRENQQKVDIIDFNQTGQPSILVQPAEEFLSDPDIEDLPLLINVDEIPPGGKFRLPVSETYDPEGKRAKLDKFKGKALVTFNVKNIIGETNEERTRLQQQAQDAVSEYINESKIKQNQEIKEDVIVPYKETDLDVIRNKALEVVNESLERSISVAKEINENVKTEIKTSEDLAELITKELSKSFEEKLENVNIRKESIKNIEHGINVSEEIKKLEKIDIETNESNIEERKLRAKQEINDAIESGTVRRTSEMFNKETIEISNPYRMEINKNYDSNHTERDKSRSRDSSAKQRAFSIGLQTIPHIRKKINPSKIDYRFTLLTTFFLQLTNIMVTLSRFIATEPNTYLGQDSYTQSQDQSRFEKKKEKSKLDKRNEQNFESFEQHEEGQGLSKYKYEHASNDSEGEIIRKGKLSGAKIAQIEGRKTTELTDKMDIVISELHKKTGFEEQSHDESYRSHSGTRSKMKSEKNTCYGESQKQQNTDHEKTYEEFFETKIQSLDISEMKSEKHSFESKTTKIEAPPCVYETTSPDYKNVTYVAIVEAHVYTNKEAIFEEQMRREREIATQNIEQTKLESNQHVRKLSLADTVIIPQLEEISANEIKEELSNIERAVTNIEQSTIKIAAKKISEVLEPLVELTSVRSHSEQQTHTSKTHLQKPRQVVESMVKSVAETTEVVTGSNIDKLITPEVVVKTPRTAIEGAFRATAETLTILPEESKSDFVESTKIKQESAKVLIGEKVSSEVIEVSLIEQREESLDEKKIKIEQPTLLIEENAFSVAQKTSISPVEPKSDIEIFTKVEKTANIKFNELKAVENTIINLEEPGNYIFETSETIEKHPFTSIEDPHLKIAEVFTILPNEPKDEHFEVSEITEYKPSINIVEKKAAETTIIRPEEPKYEQLEVLKIEEKIPETAFEGPSLKVAEVISMLSEEPKDEQLEVLKIEEKIPETAFEGPSLKVAEVISMLSEEPKDEQLEVLKIEEKIPETAFEGPSLKVAEVISMLSEEPKDEQLEVLKIEEKIPETAFEGPSLKVAEVISMLSEEPKDEFYVPEFKNQQAGITIIEFKAIEATIVEAEEPKQLELNIEQPKEKRLEEIIEPTSLSVAVKTTQNVKSDKISPTSPLSPTTPVVEEYLFSLEAELEHPYVVEEAISEEASLRIKTEKKNIQSADTSFTLAIESIVEAGSESIEEIKEIENIHLSKEVHESMYDGYEAHNINMSASTEVKSLDANQIISTEAHSLDTHHKLALKNETMMQDAINTSSLETNQNISAEPATLNSYNLSLKKSAIEQGESMSRQKSHISQSSVHKSNKVKSSQSQYSADQELKISVKSMQSGSLEASTQAKSLHNTEASNKQPFISSSKSMESTLMESNIGLEIHEKLRTDSGCEEAASKSFGTIEAGSQLSAQVIKGESHESLLDEKLTLRTDFKNTINNEDQNSPQPMPPTPLTDEYIFRLQTEMPDESTFIPRDCSFSPESIHGDVVVNGLLTNYRTKIDERIIYSPPLPTPPTSPEKAKPVYTKPGLKGGSERQKLTEEEIHESTLVSAIDRTLKQIEEYKASVGLTTEEMSYHQEDVDKEFIPIQIVEEWLDNEGQAEAKTSPVEEVDTIKITIVTEDNNAGETAVTVTTERNVDDDDEDLEIQEISSNFDEISLEIGHDRVLNEQVISDNQIDDFKPITMNPDNNLEVHEEDYEWVAVHPSSLKGTGDDDGRVSTNQSESKDLNVSALEVQAKDKPQELLMLHDQEIIGDEAIIPPVESLKDSEVIKLLNEERTVVQEKKWTTFLQKKYSPTPKTEVVYYGDFDIKTQIIPDAYKVKIVKQPKPKIAPNWKDKELKKESSPIIEISEPQTTEVTEIEDNEIIEEENHQIEEENNVTDQEENVIEKDTKTEILEEVKDKETEELELEEMAQRNLAEELIQNVENMIDINAPTDQQLEQMRDQLAALAQLPSVIQRTVELVHKRINMISEKEKQKKAEEEEYRRQEEEHRRQEEEYRRQEEEQREELERAKNSLELRVTKTEEELALLKKEAMKRRMILEEKQKKEKVELMKIDQVSRQVTQRSNPRVGRPISLFGPTQDRPVVLPGGRKWRTPEDVYDEEFITDTLVGQAEVIKGTAIGVNFMKFDKPPPALDHLKHSEVFKAIHNIEPPMKKVELLGPILSDADYREKARSMSPCVEKVAEFSGTKQS